MELVTTVHTSGINLESWSLISGSVVVPLGLLLGWVWRQVKAARAENAKAVSAAIKQATEAIVYRLNVVDQHLDRQDGALETHGQRIARLEGWMAGRAGESLPLGPKPTD
ncbi:MAG: hypothetical protein WAM97_10565 [Acidimicrobiales bacterium]